MAPEVCINITQALISSMFSSVFQLIHFINFVNQVVKNSSGCNLAVDIWSLGCTILEMATTKPPWSQYEGVSKYV